MFQILKEVEKVSLEISSKHNIDILINNAGITDLQHHFGIMMLKCE